ncbi:hypothetical protein C8N47_1349 [Mangrovibacterium marinum]|uniref:Uncharacterized protein n=1 Tax=Mangrovibacterium marinum TaxID=1639118 RepID=A0A2T5BVY8_9BACT|nr:hypothetical protein C8N47_1349 [Mangrovibacterium marinum]
MFRSPYLLIDIFLPLIRGILFIFGGVKYSWMGKQAFGLAQRAQRGMFNDLDFRNRRCTGQAFSGASRKQKTTSRSQSLYSKNTGSK